MSDEQSPTPDVATEGSQPEVESEVQAPETQEEPKSAATVSSDDFKRMQAALDRQIAAERKRNEALASEMKELKLRTLPEEEQETFRLKAQLEEQSSLIEEMQKREALQRVQTEFGVPPEILDGVQNSDEMWMRIALYQRDNKTGQATQAAPSTQAPPSATPFIAPATSGSNKARDWNKELSEAMANKDIRTYNSLMREMEAESS